MIKIAMNLAMVSSLCSPAMSADGAKALSQLDNTAAVSVPAVPAAAPVLDEAKAPAQNWDAAAKAAYDKAQDDGGLTVYADLKELPPGARRQLEQELQSLPQGPGNSSEAFKMMVNGRTAFVVQSYINSDSLRVHIFNAAGVRVAYGEGSADTQFIWLPLPAAAKAASRISILPIQAEIVQNAPAKQASANDWSNRMRVTARETAKDAQ